MSNLKILPNRSNRWNYRPGLKSLTITILDIVLIVLIVYFLKTYYKRNPFVQKKIGGITIVLAQKNQGKHFYFNLIIKNKTRKDISLDTGILMNFYLIAPNNMILYQKSFNNQRRILRPRQKIKFTTDIFDDEFRNTVAQLVCFLNSREYSISMRVR